MTEREILKHAKNYIDSLANGINPLTGEPVNEGDIVNNVRISRCLFYVSGILGKVLSGEKAIVPREKKSEFSIKNETRYCKPYSTGLQYLVFLKTDLIGKSQSACGFAEHSTLPNAAPPMIKTAPKICTTDIVSPKNTAAKTRAETGSI